MLPGPSDAVAGVTEPPLGIASSWVPCCDAAWEVVCGMGLHLGAAGCQSRKKPCLGAAGSGVPCHEGAPSWPCGVLAWEQGEQ